jgi:hypothetical protein
MAVVADRHWRRNIDAHHTCRDLGNETLGRISIAREDRIRGFGASIFVRTSSGDGIRLRSAPGSRRGTCEIIEIGRLRNEIGWELEGQHSKRGGFSQRRHRAPEYIWNAMSTTSFGRRVSWRLLRFSAGTISRNCFGRRDILAGCCVISANGLTLNTKPSGVRSAHRFALPSAGGAIWCVAGKRQRPLLSVMIESYS